MTKVPLFYFKTRLVTYDLINIHSERGGRGDKSSLTNAIPGVLNDGGEKEKRSARTDDFPRAVEARDIYIVSHVFVSSIIREPKKHAAPVSASGLEMIVNTTRAVVKHPRTARA